MAKVEVEEGSSFHVESLGAHPPSSRWGGQESRGDEEDMTATDEEEEGAVVEEGEEVECSVGCRCIPVVAVVKRKREWGDEVASSEVWE